MGLLNACSLGMAQEIRSVLLAAQAAGMDLDSVLAAANDRLAGIEGWVDVPSIPANPGRPAREICPHCGRSPLVSVANPDHLPIMGCRMCRYSTIKEVTL